jgi:branched-chain amino acid transport system permease protein
VSTPAATRPLAVGRVARAGRLRACGPWIAAALVLVALPHVIRTPVAVPIMNQMGIAIVFALSYNMLLG